MTKYRKYHWPQLFTDFEQSGLSQVEFCKQHDLKC
ncbi:IS66 family insertion sequence element accessory protein TnpA [Teredinibacter haidensis]